MIVRKVDNNQPEIVACLRKLGFQVAMTHTVSKGFPDICVSRNEKTKIIEIKDGSLPKSRRKLTTDEARFHANWKDSLPIIASLDDCIKLSQDWANV